MSASVERTGLSGAALGASAGLHLLAFLLAATPAVREAIASWKPSMLRAAAVPPSPPAPEERLITVPVVQAVPAPPLSGHFVETDGLPEEAPEPGRSRFVSDRNTRARASATGHEATGLTQQKGVDIPAVEIQYREQVDGEEDEATPPPADPVPAIAPASSPPTSSASQPAPPAAPPASTLPPPQPSTTAQAEPAPSPALKEENFAQQAGSDVAIQQAAPALAAKPQPPRLRDATDLSPVPETPPPSAKTPRTAQTHRRPTQQRGTTLANGSASVDAEDTPAGRYMKQVKQAIETEWHRKRRAHADFVTYGTIKLEFYVNKHGQVESLQIKNRDGANAVMQDFTLNAVLDAKIPPMPPGLSDVLANERMLITYDIIVY